MKKYRYKRFCTGNFLLKLLQFFHQDLLLIEFPLSLNLGGVMDCVLKLNSQFYLNIYLRSHKNCCQNKLHKNECLTLVSYFLIKSGDVHSYLLDDNDVTITVI